MAIIRQHSAEMERFFTDERRGLDSPIGFKDLPYLARPIVEHIHETRPDVVVASDRGARLIAVSALKSWRKRFPRERFPTNDGKIHFARVTSQSAEESQVEGAVHFALEAAGLSRESVANHDLPTPRVAFLDDWVNEGGTIKRFVAASESFGLPVSAVSFMTMCGKVVDEVEHMVSDPDRHTINSIWNAYEEYMGVVYSPESPTAPSAWPNDDACGARRRIEGYINEYYEQFSAAIAIGGIAACVCPPGGRA